MSPRMARMNRFRLFAAALAASSCLPSAAAEAAKAVAHREPNCIPLEDFRASKPGEFPTNWRTKYEKQMKSAIEKKNIVIVDDDKHRGIRVKYDKETVTVVRKVEGWNLETHPILEWTWKAIKLPYGANEADVTKNDAALGLYLVWEESFPMKISFLRFTWSSALPIGKIISRKFGFENIFVMDSGTEKLGTWQSHRVNAHDMTRQYIRKKDAKLESPALIALTTDADASKSEAEGVYGEMKVCRE